MRPVNQLPLSLITMKRSPFWSSRNPDSPPKPRNEEVSTSRLRYSSLSNRTRWWSRVSNDGRGRALTSIETGAFSEYSSATNGLRAGWAASCAVAKSGSAANESPAAVDFRKWRRLALSPMSSGMQSAPLAAGGRRNAMSLAEQLGEFLGDGAAEFLGIDDGDRAAIIAGDIVTDADRDQLDRRAGLDFLDDMAQMTLQVIAGIDRQRGVIDRRAVGDHHQDLALLGAAQQPLVRPVQRLAVDVFLEQALAHHQPEIFPGATPRRIGGFIDDMPQVVQPSGIGWLAGREPRLARLPALPRPRGKAENLDLDAAALQCPRQNIRAGRCNRNRPPAHRTGIVQQQRHHGVAERRFLFVHERQRMIGIGDHARQPGGIENAFLQIKLPGAVLLRYQ